VGYYIEPELGMKSNFLEVKKIKVKRLETEEGMQELMNT
jgi:hypothetical protein